MLFALETFGSIAVSSVMYLLSAWYGSNPGPADRVRADSPAMDIADAEARADALTDELAKVAAALRRSRRKRRQQHEDPKKFLKERLCGFLGRLVLTMFQMCGHVTRVPADFLHGHGRRKIRVHGSCTMEDTEEAVQGLYMQTTAAQLADLMVVSQENQSSRFLHVHAARYVLEHRLFEWLLHQNCERGVAPSSRALLEQVPNMLPGSLDESIRAAILEAINVQAASGRQWVARWRRRWGTRWGRLAPRLPLTVEDMNRRVPVQRFMLRVTPGATLKL